MKIWVLLAIAIVLLLWRTTRERMDEQSEDSAAVALRQRQEERRQQEEQRDEQSDEQGPAPMCPAGTIFNSENECVASEVTNFTCPTEYEISGSRCKRIGGTEVTDPVCPADMTFSSELNGCEGEPVPPTCPSAYEFKDGKCIPKPSSGTTTGGVSDTSYGPTSGGSSGRARQVFGPVFTSKGDASTGGVPDSTTSNVYPELLGGRTGDPSTRIPGAGIVAPSKNWTLTQNGSLPSMASLGATGLSRFFPFSRQPGDMDLIPDPYRVSKTFSTGSYSSKTEPMPFLTDFSAFLK